MGKAKPGDTVVREVMTPDPSPRRFTYTLGEIVATRTEGRGELRITAYRAPSCCLKAAEDCDHLIAVCKAARADWT